MSLMNKQYGVRDFGNEAQIVAHQSEFKDLANNALRVKVISSSVNPIDIKTRKGLGYVAAAKPEQAFLPLGYDLYGEVIACGERTGTVSVGQHVIGMVGFAATPGCYADYVDVSEDEIIVIDTEQKLEVAGLCLAGLTALQALNTLPLDTNKTLYINAPTGGVGHLALQLAKMQSRPVVALSNRPEHALLAKLHVEAMSYTDFLDKPRSGQLLDLVGGETALSLLDNLAPGSEVVTVPTITKDSVCEKATQLGISAAGMLVSSNKDDLMYLYKAYKDNKLIVHVEKQFALNEIGDAHRFMETQPYSGKVIITA